MMKYYFFYLEVPKTDIQVSGISKTNSDNMIKVFNSIRQDAVKEAAFVYGKVITEDDVIVKQFNRL